MMNAHPTRELSSPFKPRLLLSTAGNERMYQGDRAALF